MRRVSLGLLALGLLVAPLAGYADADRVTTMSGAGVIAGSVELLDASGDPTGWFAFVAHLEGTTKGTDSAGAGAWLEAAVITPAGYFTTANEPLAAGQIGLDAGGGFLHAPIAGVGFADLSIVTGLPELAPVDCLTMGASGSTAWSVTATVTAPHRGDLNGSVGGAAIRTVDPAHPEIAPFVFTADRDATRVHEGGAPLFVSATFGCAGSAWV